MRPPKIKLQLSTEDLEMLLQELDLVDFQPEPLELEGATKKLVKKADQKATEVAIRTIKNPTYKSLPVKGSGKTRAKVLHKIFSRHRSAALKNRSS